MEVWGRQSLRLHCFACLQLRAWLELCLSRVKLTLDSVIVNQAGIAKLAKELLNTCGGKPAARGQNNAARYFNAVPIGWEEAYRFL